MQYEMTLDEYRAWVRRQPKPRTQNEETPITWAVIEYLTAVGVACARTHAGEVEVKGGYMRLAPAAWPDVSGTLPGGRSVYVETKVPGEVPTPEQEDMHEWLRSLGALVIVASSIDQVRMALRAAGVQTREAK